MKNLLFLLFVVNLSMAQTTLSGKVLDAATKEPIPFASVGIKGKNIGTVCNENGIFEIQLKDFNTTDSLKISSIGYLAQSFNLSKVKDFNNETIYLKPNDVLLNELVIKPTKTITKVLGNKKYNTNIHCSFQGADKNFKGVEAAIKANNKKGRLVWIEDFNFYITKNLIDDSITFRLNFYTENKDGLPEKNILRQPIIFKIKTKSGVVSLDLKKYNINTNDDFFISLESLTDKINSTNFSFSGSIMGPSYFKMATFSNFEKIPLMGLDFNVTVSYQK